MSASRPTGDSMERAIRTFTRGGGNRSPRRLITGWLSALLLVLGAAPALHQLVVARPAANSTPDTVMTAAEQAPGGEDGGLRIRLVDDSVPTTEPATTGTGPATTGTGPATTGTVPPTTGTVPPTTGTVPPTTGTVPPTTGTVPPTTGTTPPTTESTTTSTPSTVPPTTEPVGTIAPPVAPPPSTHPAPIPAAPIPPPPSPTPPPTPAPAAPPVDTGSEPAEERAVEEPPEVAAGSEPETDPEPDPEPETEKPSRETLTPVRPQESSPPPSSPESQEPVEQRSTSRGIAAAELSSFGRDFPTFGNGDFSPKRVGVNTVLAAVLSLLLILPAELFNATLRVNYELVLAPVQRLRAASTAMVEAVENRLPGSRFAGTAIFALVAALASSALDPRFGLGWGSLRLLVAQTLALFASTFAVCRISLIIGRRHGVGGEIALRPGGLVLCFGVVLLSRAIGVSPGFLYGLVVGLQFHAPMSIERVGRIALVQAGFLLSLGVSSWLLLGAFHDVFAGPRPGLLPSLGAEILTSLSIGTTTGLVLSMMPLTYLRGERLFVWKRPLWFLMYSLVFFAFLSIAVNPVFGSLPSTDSIRLWVGLYVLFGVGSVLFWLRYRNTENRSALDRLTEALPRL